MFVILYTIVVLVWMIEYRLSIVCPVSSYLDISCDVDCWLLNIDSILVQCICDIHVAFCCVYSIVCCIVLLLITVNGRTMRTVHKLIKHSLSLSFCFFCCCCIYYSIIIPLVSSSSSPDAPSSPYRSPIHHISAVATAVVFQYTYRRQSVTTMTVTVTAMA